MSKRHGVSLLELFTVLAILIVLLAILLPAAQASRSRARETVCKNNLHQLNLAVAQFVSVHKRLPAPSSVDVVGGWAVDILPFLDQGDLAATIPANRPLMDLVNSIVQQPAIMRCPLRTTLDNTTASSNWPAHYVFVPTSGRRSYLIADAPTALSVAWPTSPEMTYTDLLKTVGPHRDGLFVAHGFQPGISFLLNGEEALN